MLESKSSLRIPVALCILLLTLACQQSHRSADYTDEERAAMDSIIGSIRNTDSLLEQNRQFAEDNHLLGQMATLKALGRRMRDQSHFEDAIEYHMQELQLAVEAEDTLEMAQAYNCIGTDFRRVGQLEEATHNHLQALSLIMEKADHSGAIAQKCRVMALNGMGNVYLTLQDWEQADSCLRQALQGERALGSALGQAINLANLGYIKEMAGQHDSAWAYYQESLNMNEQAGATLGIAISHQHFGELHEKEGQLEEALKEYAIASDLMSQSKDEWHRLDIMLGIAGIYIRQHQFDLAQEELNEANETARRIGSREHMALVHRLLYELYEEKGDIRQALQHHLLYDQMRDSVVNLQKMTNIQNMNVTIASKRQQNELTALTEDLHHMRSQRLTIIYVTGFIILLAVTFLIYQWYRLRLRMAKQRMMQQTQKTREDFFTNITHEFRTPLTVILGLGHQLEDQEVEDMGQVRSSAKMIVRQSNSLLGLINQLLDISKVRSAVGTPQWFHGNIVAYVEMAIQYFQPYADSKCQELTYTHSMTRIDMDFVPDYMQKIISNLLSNSIKYTPKYGKVNLTLEQTANNRVKIQVFDTGRGINAEDLPHIFEPFFEGRQNAGDIGTGVGLSLTKMIVEALNGDISVDSIEGQGATFTILLPMKHANTTEVWNEKTETLAHNPAMTDNEEAAVIDSPSNNDTQHLNDCKILIVEDNQDIAYYIGMQLCKAQLFYARNGADGLQKAREIVPNLIITDIMMPGELNGMELCRQIKKDDQLGRIPIIIITAKTTEEDRIQGLKAGADAYLVKPFNSEELLVRVEKLLESQQKITTMLSQIGFDTSDKSTRLSADDQRFMNKLVTVVYRLMARGSLSMEAVADEMAVSRAHLNRKVMAITGSNSSTYVMRLRMLQAKRLLKADLNMPIGDVAQRCGFDDVAYFSRIFKQTFDITPTRYRQID
ncbi:MAG: response regulator [Prevotella sp.]|nr:response regulator [Prevotella sp.]